MRGCDLRSFQCEDEGAYLAYVTKIRDTQKGRKARPSLRLVVGLNRAAASITARTNNDRVAEISSCGFSVSASVGIAAAELADIRSSGKRRTFVRKLSQFPPQ